MAIGNDDKSVTLNLGTGGANVRTVEVNVANPDGSTTTVEMQAMVVYDKDGRALYVLDLATADLQRQQLHYLERIAIACEAFANIPTLEDIQWPAPQ